MQNADLIWIAVFNEVCVCRFKNMPAWFVSSLDIPCCIQALEMGRGKRFQMWIKKITADGRTGCSVYTCTHSLSVCVCLISVGPVPILPCCSRTIHTDRSVWTLKHPEHHLASAETCLLSSLHPALLPHSWTLFAFVWAYPTSVNK